MTDAFTPRRPRLPRGRPFEKGQSGNPSGRRVGCRNKTTIAAGGVITPAEAATIAAVVDTFVRAIESSDFERRLQLVEAEGSDHSDAATGMNGAGPGQYYNP